jgi:geranylgeranyl diphosphate synthase type II
MKIDASQRRYAALRRMVDRRLAAVVKKENAGEVREMLRYVVSGGGKRVRSVLVLLSCEAVGGAARDSLDAAVGIELMHHFTLVHDDIMDNAPTRRGRPTIHQQWGVSYGILAGDVLLGLAFGCLLRARYRNLTRVIQLFNDGLLQVCGGQGVDLSFEARSDVGLAEYFTMIEQKTAALLSTAAMMGGLIGSGSERQIEALRRFGRHLGRAFQIQDDLLDVIADQGKFGKVVGGDIVEGKKTYLLVKAMEVADRKEKGILRALGRPGGKPGNVNRTTVRRVMRLYRKRNVIEAAREQIQLETREAMKALRALPRNDGTAMLYWLSDMLLRRVS